MEALGKSGAKGAELVRPQLADEDVWQDEES